MNTKNINKFYTILLVLLSMLCIGSFYVGTVITNASVEDATQISISVDTLSYESDYLPNGVVGKTYPVFDFYAIDNNGNTVVDAEVLVISPNGKYVPITNGRFNTEYEGRYTIIYKATKGVIETKVELFVDVIDSAEYIAPIGDFKKEFVCSLNTGDKAFLPELIVSNGLGNVNIKRTIKYSGEYECDDIVVEDYGYDEFFVPVVSGEYTVEYILCDIVGAEISIPKTIVVTDSTVPTLNIPAMPLVAIVGETIAFERMEAFVYINGKQIYLPVKTFVNELDVTDTMIFTPNEVGVINVKYEAVNIFSSNVNDVAKFETGILVKDVEENKNLGLPYVNNYLHFDNFDGAWVAEPEDVTEKVKGIEYDVYTLTTKGEKDTATVQFKTAIPNEYAYMKIGFNTVRSFFEDVYLYYTDSVNADKTVEICLKKGEANITDVWVNGVFARSISQNFTNLDASIKETIFCFEIDNYGVLTETSSNIVITQIPAYKNGDKFDFFPSGKIYLSASLNGISQESDLKIYEISNQSISGQIRDRSKPIFIASEDYSDVFNIAINQSFSIMPLSVFDLYSDKVNVAISVIGPNKQEVYSAAQSDNNCFTPNQYGKYTIYYRATDSANNSNEKTCVVNVLDIIAPVISTVSVPSKVKVGDVVEFEKVKAVDNHTQVLTTWIYVTDDNFQRTTLDVDNKFKFNKAGTYLIKYGAEDDDGNYTVITYTVICE